MSLPYIVEALNKAEDENNELRWDMEDLIKAFKITNSLINEGAIVQENEALMSSLIRKYGLEI